ncbi:MAG: Pycsar system effector family protein [Cyanobacteria bacterium P01_G01_bin.19]
MSKNQEQQDNHGFEPALKDRDVIYALRTVHQNQMQLILLADQKANILIGIVAVIFTILFTNANFLTDISQWLLVPFACFLLVEVMVAVLALLVIFPKNINRLRKRKIEDMSNPLFFGSFIKFKEYEFVDFLFNELNNDQAARIHLIKDIYQMGLVLKKKYLLLRYAYIFAVIGIALLLFLIVIFPFID